MAAIFRNIATLLMLWSVSASSDNRPQLNVACFDFPLLFEITDNGEFRGQAKNTLQTIFNRMGYQVVFHHLPQQRAVSKVIKGELDVICATPINYLPESLATSETAYYDGIAKFYKRKHDPWLFTNLDSLKNKTVVSVRGFDYSSVFPAYHEYTTQHKSELVIMLHGDNPWERMVKMILSGRADTALLGIEQAENLINKLGIGDQLIAVEGFEGHARVHVSFSQKVADLQPIFDRINLGVTQ